MTPAARTNRELQSYTVPAPGHALQEFEDLYDGMEIQLKKGILVTLQLTWESGSPGPMIVLPSIKGIDYQPRNQEPSIQFDENGRAEYLAPKAGKYRMDYTSTPGSFDTTLSYHSGRLEIDIPQEGGLIEVEIPAGSVLNFLDASDAR